MRRRKKTITNVEVIDIADKGNALGRTPEGEILLLHGAVPGDNVDALIVRKKKGLKFGKITKTNLYSQYRVDPFCEHFGVCGGCKWQNLNYAKQTELKENAVKAAIRRIANDDENKVEPILKGKKTRHYRNKLEYAFSNKRWITEEEVKSELLIEDRNAVGFHKTGAFDKVVDIRTCHLQEDLSNKIRNYIRELANQKSYSFYDIRNNSGLLRNLIIRNTSIGEWMVVVVFGEKNEFIEDIMSSLVGRFPEVHSWHYVINEKGNDSIFDQKVNHYKGQTKIYENLGHIKCQIGPKSFFQTNSAQAKALYDVAADFADLRGNEIVYDLYTGTGTIALYIAKDCNKAIGIEVIQEAIDDAKENKRLNALENCEFLVGDVKDTLQLSFRETYGVPDIIFSDPPRAGMHQDVVNTILEINSPKLVYISCNPSTQARDISLLKEKYTLIKCRPVDMFPHTSHIENVALLHLR